MREPEQLFEEPQNVFEKQIRDIFQIKEPEKQEPLFQILSLVIHHNQSTSDIQDVYRLLGLEDFVRLIHLLDGRTVRFPTSMEMREALVVAICYYYREVEHLEWKEVKERIPFEFQSIAMAHKIKNLNLAFATELRNIFSGGTTK